jgi:hypothetical protein
LGGLCKHGLERWQVGAGPGEASAGGEIAVMFQPGCFRQRRDDRSAPCQRPLARRA